MSLAVKNTLSEEDLDELVEQVKSGIRRYSATGSYFFRGVTIPGGVLEARIQQLKERAIKDCGCGCGGKGCP